MNDKDYTDILTRHGVPVPPSWGGMIGSGSEQMFSLGGRWLKAGQRSPQGHTIDSLDPKTGFLNLSYQGVPLMPLKMRDAVIQDYVPEFTNPYANTEHEMDYQKLKNAGVSDEHIDKILFPQNKQSMREIFEMYRKLQETRNGEYLQHEMDALKQTPKVYGQYQLEQEEMHPYLQDPSVQLFGDDGFIK